ncbi:MAG: hypothetical protein ACOCYQ_01160 [Alkalispirochaeta sp.]
MNQQDEGMKGVPYEDDTISLIDLIAVVVRYRRVVVIGTVLVFLATLGALYLPPLAGLGSAENGRQYRVEQKLQIQPLSSEVSKYASIELGRTFQEVMTDPRVVIDPYRELLEEEDPIQDSREERSPEKLTREELTTYLSEEFIGGAYKVTRDGNTITVSLVSEDAEQTQTFLAAVVERARQEISVRLAPQLARTEATIAEVIDITGDSIAQVVSQGIQDTGSFGSTEAVDSLLARISTSASGLIGELRDLTYVQNEVVSIKGNVGALVTPINEPLVYALPQEQGRDPKMILVIATITAFFLTVFLAFVLEYVRRVRKDPEEMGKLRAAWRREDL